MDLDHPFAHVPCPVRCQCGDVLLTTEELEVHRRATLHCWYWPLNGGYT
ncbi:MAG: hypothetical protein V3U45_02320 [bacterium]